MSIFSYSSKFHRLGFQKEIKEGQILLFNENGIRSDFLVQVMVKSGYEKFRRTSAIRLPAELIESSYREGISGARFEAIYHEVNSWVGLFQGVEELIPSNNNLYLVMDQRQRFLSYSSGFMLFGFFQRPTADQVILFTEDGIQTVFMNKAMISDGSLDTISIPVELIAEEYRDGTDEKTIENMYSGEY